MEPLQIILIVLVVAGVWAVVELALALRRMRTTMDGIDKTMAEVTDAVVEAKETLAETRPVIAKLDGAIDDMQPALERVEPLLESAHIATNALSADLVEVEAVIRDVSAFTGAAANAGSAFTNAADTASEAVQRLLGRRKATPAPDTERALEAGATAADVEPSAEETAPVASKYYTSEGSGSDATDAEATHE